jgi:hypothetical protein
MHPTECVTSSLFIPSHDERDSRPGVCVLTNRWRGGGGPLCAGHGSVHPDHKQLNCEAGTLKRLHQLTLGVLRSRAQVKRKSQRFGVYLAITTDDGPKVSADRDAGTRRRRGAPASPDEREPCKDGYEESVYHVVSPHLEFIRRPAKDARHSHTDALVPVVISRENHVEPADVNKRA